MQPVGIRPMGSLSQRRSLGLQLQRCSPWHSVLGQRAVWICHAKARGFGEPSRDARADDDNERGSTKVRTRGRRVQPPPIPEQRNEAFLGAQELQQEAHDHVENEEFSKASPGCRLALFASWHATCIYIYIYADGGSFHIHALCSCTPSCSACWH